MSRKALSHAGLGPQAPIVIGRTSSTTGTGASRRARGLAHGRFRWSPGIPADAAPFAARESSSRAKLATVRSASAARRCRLARRSPTADARPAACLITTRLGARPFTAFSPDRDEAAARCGLIGRRLARTRASPSSRFSISPGEASRTPGRSVTSTTSWRVSSRRASASRTSSVGESPPGRRAARSRHRPSRGRVAWASAMPGRSDGLRRSHAVAGRKGAHAPAPAATSSSTYLAVRRPACLRS